MAKYGYLEYELPILKLVQCISTSNPQDNITGSGYLWTCGEVLELPETVSNTLASFTTVWRIVDEPLTLEEIQAMPHNEVFEPRDYHEDDKYNDFQPVNADDVPEEEEEEELVSSDEVESEQSEEAEGIGRMAAPTDEPVVEGSVFANNDRATTHNEAAEPKAFNWQDSEDEDALIEYGTSIGIEGLNRRCSPRTLRERIGQHLEAQEG